MKYISLFQDRVAIVDDADFNWLNQWRWSVAMAGNTYYATRLEWRGMNSKRVFISMHRLIMNAPRGTQIDHINGDGFDNRRSNLRFCTNTENLRHQKLSRRSKTGFKGVRLVKNNPKKPYGVAIKAGEKRIHLGYYKTAREAAQAYDNAALIYHGQFALTNKKLGLL